MKHHVDLHAHTNLDPVDGISSGGLVTYSYEDAILAAKRAGISVLSLTHHKKLIYTKEMVVVAKKHGVHLISGVEAVINGGDVLLINTTTDKITTYAQLRAEKKRNKHLLVIAPHPFYPASHSVGFDLIRHIDLFDAIEYCHFHTWWFNVSNWLAMWVARRHNKSLIGTSDSHRLGGFGLTYSVISLEHVTTAAIIAALKTPKRVSVVTKRVSFSYVCSVVRAVFLSFFR